MVCVFFFKQKTAYELRISDWSSDVCSSDLLAADLGERVVRTGIVVERHCAAIGREVVGAQPILANDDVVGRNRADLPDETREVEGDLGSGRPVVTDDGCAGRPPAAAGDPHHPWHAHAPAPPPTDCRGGTPS